MIKITSRKGVVIMSLATLHHTNSSFNACGSNITYKEYIELELQELNRHCWIAVEKRVQAIEKQGQTLAQAAAAKGCSTEELLEHFRQDAIKAWVKKYAKVFHGYHAPRIV